MKAIIVPGVTDLNKGDQALVWESHRLVEDIGLFHEIYLLSSGDTKEEEELLCSQTKQRGFKFIQKILKHPRRGRHIEKEAIKDSPLSLFILFFNAFKDFVSTSFLLFLCKNDKLVKLFFDKNTYTTLSHFKESDVIFVKGGGFIHAYGEKTAPYLMWYFLFYTRLAKRLSKKVVFLPNSFGPFIGLTVKNQVRKVFNQVDKVFARELKSSTKLGRLLGKSIEVSPDLGFYLRLPIKDANQNSLLEKYGLSKEEKIIGITVRPWRFPGAENPGSKYLNYINSVTHLIKHLIEINYKVALCNQSIGPNAHEDDRNAINEVTSSISSKNLVWINEDLPCDELKSLYSNFHAFIGTRFHSVIFSLTSTVPSIAIGYGGNKAEGIMSDFNLKEFVVQIEDVSSTILIEKFNELIKNHEKIKCELKLMVKEINEQRSDTIESIKKIVSNEP